ncbi:MAG: TIGR00180 family glycosyltransferase [Holosporales bacterium]|nr:TIGR00180 family glycosyltransferase [Holosporales bacterium]
MSQTSSFVKLTLLVFLKDRFAFTKRLCAYLQDINYPYHVIFADGSGSDDHKKYFGENRFSFSYEYKKYPVDKDIYAYAKKARLASALVKTPYVMLCDNDDFPIVSGQDAALGFLENHSDYIGCNGRVRGLILDPDASKPAGRYIFWKKYYCNDMDFPVRVDQASAVERITAWQPSCCSLWYSVFRTEALKQMYEDMDKLVLSDFGPMELFFSYFILSKGKVAHINDTTYIRQQGSSQASASQGDSFFMRLFFHDWMNDVRKVMDYMQAHYPNEETPTGQNLRDYLYYILAKRSENCYCMRMKSCLSLYKWALERGIFIELLIKKLFKLTPNLVSKLSGLLNKNFASNDEVKAVENAIIGRVY